jgi:hypothetical protein
MGRPHDVDRHRNARDRRGGDDVLDDPQDQPQPAADARRTAATQAWFAQLEALLGRLIAAQGAPDAEVVRGPGVEQPAATEQALLLDLARIAAHRSERWTAPVSTYLAGTALAPYEPAVRAQVLADLVAGLEPGGG